MSPTFMGRATLKAIKMPDIKPRTSYLLMAFLTSFLIFLPPLASSWLTYASSVTRESFPLASRASTVRSGHQEQEPSEQCDEIPKHCVSTQNVSETFKATSEFEFRPRLTYRIRHHIITPQSHSRVSPQTNEHACPTPITIKLSHHHSLRGPNQTTVSKPTKIKFPAHNLKNLNIKNTNETNHKGNSGP